MILTSYTIREIRRRPGRTILTLLGIVIGVQALVAIPLTIQTTRHTHRALFEGITGRAALEVVPFGQGGFEPELSRRVEDVEGVVAAGAGGPATTATTSSAPRPTETKRPPAGADGRVVYVGVRGGPTVVRVMRRPRRRRSGRPCSASWDRRAVR